jgi:very-short-patch-repair endonuclease
MLTGVLRNRPRTEVLVRERAANSIDDALTQLLRSRSLRRYRFVSDVEIGPFVVDHLCPEQALVIDLTRSASEQEARARFFESLGYRVVVVSRRDLFHRPEAVLLRLRRLLQQERSG